MTTARSYTKLLTLILASLILFSACGHGDRGKETSERKKEKRGLEPVQMPKSDDMTIRLRENKDAKLESPRWSYEGAMGPSNWSALSQAFITCSEGNQQSPIDLKWRRPSGTESIQFAYRQEPLKINNTGRFIQIEFTQDQGMLIGNQKYGLKTLRFHSPSEHTFSGKEFPAELAFTHQGPQGQSIIVSVVLAEGEANEALTRILPHIPADPQQAKTTNEINIHPLGLLPLNYNHYRYEGSESIPPCTEGVTRVVLNTPLEASAEQIARIRSFYYGNRRPSQPLGNHNIQLFFGQ